MIAPGPDEDSHTAPLACDSKSAADTVKVKWLVLKGRRGKTGSGLSARVRLWDGGVRKWTVRRGGEQASNVRYMMSTMPKRQRNAPDLPLEDALFAAKARKKVPHEFVLEA